jgi:hypothetical protein
MAVVGVLDPGHVFFPLWSLGSTLTRPLTDGFSGGTRRTPATGVSLDAKLNVACLVVEDAECIESEPPEASI